MAKIVLNNPVYTDPGASAFRVKFLALNVQSGEVVVQLGEVDNGNFKDLGISKTITISWQGAEGMAIIKALNKANLSTKSLQQRIIEKAIADGKLGDGTVDTGDEA